MFETVIVTAQKREQSIYDVPVAISAFTPETIEKQGITDLTDIGKFVPNLNITGFSAGHTSSQNPFIRGIGLQDHLITTEPGVGVYVDGVYLGRQVGQNWSLANIERVEVLRGPQGTLYGRNSIGGAINIITRKPGDKPGGKVSLTAGSRGRLNGDVYADMPLSDEFAMSFGVAYQRRDGLGDFLLIEDPNKEVGEMQDVSGRIAMQWKPTDNLSFLLTGDGNDGENGLRPYDTLIDELGAACRANPPAPPATCNAANGAVYNAGYRNSDQASDPYDNNTGQASQIEVTNKAYGVSLTVDLEVSDALNFRLLASDRHSEYESGLDDDSFNDDFLSFPEIGSADQQSVELQATGKAGAFDYVLGLFYYEEEGQNFQNDTQFNCGTAASPCTSPPGSDFFLHQKYDSLAVYANVGFQVTDQFRIAAGLRQTEDDKSADTEPVVGVIGGVQFQRWVGNHLGRLGLVQIRRPVDVLWFRTEWLPGRPVPGASVLPVREPQLFRGHRERHGDQLRSGHERRALRQPAAEHRLVQHGLYGPALPGEHDDGGRLQYAKHRRGSDLARRRA